jgi:dienelactone hydrolase
VVIQEIFGVNHHIRHVTDGFATDGGVAIAPALFDRVEPSYARDGVLRPPPRVAPRRPERPRAGTA